MKQFYLILAVISLISHQSLHSQEVIFFDDFETGYTDGTEIKTTDDTWSAFGDGFTFPAKNVPSAGAESSDWYFRMETATGPFAAVERIYALTAGKTYTFTAWVLPDAPGERNAYTLRVMDGNTMVMESAKPPTGGWEQLTVTYTAAESKDYKFRINKNWGVQGASFDNYSIVCDDCTTASVKDNNNFDFTLFPNPVKDIFYYNSEEKLAAIKIYNLLGKEVLKVNEPSQNKIDISNLSKGIYILKLEAYNGGTAVRKIMKQ
ncbi:T9SS type A sorting domain-containing protein [Polaribacter sp.]|uniref:T9SS type A sorting domain-containing protein n=1 Tax=Polaribacter sp. TaxID=1920175 RepID=UPI003F699327